MKSVLAIDLGNSQLSAALFCQGIMSKPLSFPVDEIANLDLDSTLLKQQPDTVIISSVVPAQSELLCSKFSKGMFKLIELKSGKSSHISKTYETLGTDRIANLIAARHLYGKDIAQIVIDCGTATTLSAVNSKSEFAGGFITLGLGASVSMLNKRTAQLPRPDLMEAQSKKLGFNTEEAILNGTLIAQLAAIETWINLCLDYLEEPASITVTGGWSNLIYKNSKLFDRQNKDLTLLGVYLSAFDNKDLVL